MTYLQNLRTTLGLSAMPTADELAAFQARERLRTTRRAKGPDNRKRAGDDPAGHGPGWPLNPSLYERQL